MNNLILAPEEKRGNPTKISIAACSQLLLPLMTICTVAVRCKDAGLAVFSRKFVIHCMWSVITIIRMGVSTLCLKNRKIYILLILEMCSKSLKNTGK